MTESPNFPWCGGCPLPDILKKITQTRNGAQVANANAVASGSPTEAYPYQQEAQTETEKLRKEIVRLDRFMTELGNNCPSCTLL